MRNRLIVVGILSLLCAGSVTAADRASAVTILTQNMDAGTDQSYIVAAALNLVPGFSVADAIDLTAQELQASNIELRARALASKIAASKPDLIALQEATRWEIDLTSPAPEAVVYDQLDFLLDALGSQGVPYQIVAVNNVNDLSLPGNHVASVRFTDRNALLVRSGLGPPELHFSDIHTHLFDTVFNFAGLPISAGWIAADVHTANRHFRLITTHLTSSIPGVAAATEAQVAQAQELLQALRNTQIPVVICGDFNSDANGGHFVDATPTAGLIQAAGYPEVWPQTHGPSEPGLTWPYYLEDLFPPPPFVAPAGPLERIDLFFEKGMQVDGSELMLAPTGATPPNASDHAGVIATLRP
jgi:endonuclease/exonuclease/phosphatase family metal-dependent hydrolase